MEKRGQFTFYRSYYEAIMDVEESKRLQLLMAVILYALDGREPRGLVGASRGMFRLIRPTLDTGRKKAAGGQHSGKIQARCQQDAGKEKEIEIEGEKENEIEIEDDSLFAAFWAAYPRRTERKKAFAVWLRLRPDAKAVMQGLQKWKRSKEWTRENGRFVPSAVKWLEGEYWMYPPEDTATPCGAVGELGEAELEAIQRVLRESN